jgi:hypothetical protein
MAQLLSLLLLAVMIFAIVDAVTSDNWRIRFMPKVAWVLLIVFLPLVGSVLWFILGKERQVAVDRGGFGDPRRREGVRPASSRTEDDLAAIEREIAFHEKQAEIRRLEAQLKAKRNRELPE